MRSQKHYCSWSHLVSSTDDRRRRPAAEVKDKKRTGRRIFQHILQSISHNSIINQIKLVSTRRLDNIWLDQKIKSTEKRFKYDGKQVRSPLRGKLNPLQFMSWYMFEQFKGANEYSLYVPRQVDSSMQYISFNVICPASMKTWRNIPHSGVREKCKN